MCKPAWEQYMVGILWRKYVYMYTITVYNISRGICVKGILYSPDAGHSGREESAEWLDLARGVTVSAVHSIPPCSRDECGIEQLVKLMWPLATPPSCWLCLNSINISCNPYDCTLIFSYHIQYSTNCVCGIQITIYIQYSCGSTVLLYNTTDILIQYIQLICTFNTTLLPYIRMYGEVYYSSALQIM